MSDVEVPIEPPANRDVDIGDSNDPLFDKPIQHHHQDKKHKKKKHHHGGLIIQTLPPSPRDCCDFLDPYCNNDLHLAIITTVCCWLLLGVIPVVFGFVSIYYAIKARDTKDEELKQKYSSKSRSISWVGMLLFTVVVTIAVVILATCGIL
uniref:Uncharacterized LOC100184438 n=1 Tax=Ciona intestinalis TaxID=7719 RepID=F6PK00_CIOIN|nr:uncharacterized protein LOC100184438 [Ciona intestinalis]|eukprot:XP_002130511.1 uncharacterized protein LOC100184438 [Ciona intestinalis]